GALSHRSPDSTPNSIQHIATVMNANIYIARVMRTPRIAALSYAVCVLALGLVAVSAFSDIVDRYRAVEESKGVLARLEQRTTLQSSEPGWSSDLVPPGSPFLEG